MDHFSFLFAAYSVVWIAIFLYVLSVDRRGRRTEGELEALKQSLRRGSPRPSDESSRSKGR